VNSPAGWHPEPSGREWKKRGNEIKSKNRKPLIIAGVVLGWIGLGVSVQHPWVLAVLVLVGGIGGVIWWMRRDEWMRRDDAKRARLAAHAAGISARGRQHTRKAIGTPLAGSTLTRAARKAVDAAKHDTVGVARYLRSF
jgi:hypothetical protein